MRKFSLEIKRLFISLIIGLVFVFSFSQFFTKPAEAGIGINRQINFQGKLVNNPSATNVANTSYTVVFTLYDNASGGTQLWQETQSVTTTDGIFRVALGSVTAFPANFNFNWSGLYLGIKVNADSEMTPRVQMAAVPFAFNAEKVAGLTVQDTSGSASTSGTLQIANAKTVSFADAFTTSGAFSLTLTTTASTNVTLPTTGILLTNTASANQTITSTQTTGNILSLADSTGLTGGITGLTVGLTSSTNSQNKTGISFDLSGGTGGVYYDLLGTGSTWSITRAGVLSVASCSGCGGSGVNWWNQLAGALSPLDTTNDFLIGSTATSSALFSYTGIKTGQTNASISGQLIVMANNGWGGNATISGALTLGAFSNGVIQTTNNQLLTLGGNTTGDIQFKPGNSSTGLYLQSTGNVGIGTTVPSVKLNVATSGNAVGILNEATDTGYTAIRSKNTAYAGYDYGIAGGAAAVPNAFYIFDVAQSATRLSINPTTGNISIGGMFTANAPLSFGTGVQTNKLYLYDNTSDKYGFGVATNTLQIYTGAAAGANATIQFGKYDGTTLTEFARILDGRFGIGITAPTAPLHVNSGYGSNAAFIVNNLNSGDLIAASASGVTKFRLDTSGNASMSGSLTMVGANSIQTTSNTALTIGGATTGNITLSPNNGTAGLVSISGSSLFTTGTGLTTLGGSLTISGTAITLASATTIDSSGAINLGTTNATTLTLGRSTQGITLPGFLTCTLKTDGSGVLQCGTDLQGSGGGYSPFQELSGAILPNNSTMDFLIGGQATTSAKFAVLGVNTGQTIASVSGQFIVMPQNGWGGSFGIGTTTPVAPLDVRGQAIISKNANTIDALYDSLLVGRRPNNDAYSSLRLSPQDSTARGWKIEVFDPNSTAHYFKILNQVAATTPFLIDSSGNVGIGTVTPTALLDVTGTASVGGQLTFRSGTAQVQSTANQGLILGGNTTGNITISPLNGGAGSLFTVNALTTNFSGAVTGVTTLAASGDITWSATTPTITINAAETFTISNGTAADNLVYNTSTNALTLGDGTNGLTFDIDTGMAYQGSGRKTKTIHLAPEYPGAILTASGSATTNGSMTSDASPSATFQNYYEWSSTQASLQDYTVAVHVELPADFSAWPTSNAITVEFNTATTNAPQNKFDFILFNTSDASPKTPVVMRTANVSSVAKTWETLTITGAALTSGTATLNTAGHEAVIYLKMYAGSPGYVQVGDIELNYLSAF